MRAKRARSTGSVTFYVTDESHRNLVFAGADNDTDGDGIYQIQWTANENWAFLGTQHWTAEFTGTPDYMPSSASADFTITYNGAEMWLDPTFKTVKIGSATTYELTFKWNKDTQDTFDLSITGLDPSWYTLSQTSITVNSNGQTQQVTLTVSPPIAVTELGNYDFSITATSRQNSSFTFSINATAQTYFTQSTQSYRTGGLAAAITPKTALASIAEPYEPTEIVVHIENTQNINDAVTLEITMFGIPLDYQAQWFSWTTKELFIPANGEANIPLTITIWPTPETTPPSILPDLDGFIFKIRATSNTDTSTTAVDPAIIEAYISTG